MGPLQPAWTQWRLWPQPSNLTTINATVPMPAGYASIQLDAVVAPGGTSSVTVHLTVPAGTTAQVCLPLPGSAAAQERLSAAVGRGAASDTLLVDGAAVNAVPFGRFSCAPSMLAAGAHTVARVVS